MCIKSDSNKLQQHQKSLFAVSEINKIEIGISIFLLKARVSYLTILKRKNLSIPLKDETDRFVTCLVLLECLSVKIAFHPRTVKRIVMAPMPSPAPFPLFFSFSASFKSPREKGRKLSSFWDWLACERRRISGCHLVIFGGIKWQPEIRLRSQARDWWVESLFLSIIVAKYLNIFPHATTRAKKKILAKRFARAIRVQNRDLEHAYIYWIWLRGSASYVMISNNH